MNFFQKFIGHFKVVVKHKIFVFKFCCLAGIPVRGFFHDFSKFSPVEFFESVKYFTGKRSPIELCKQDKGYSLAWQHHKGRNRHHFEYWIDRFEEGGKPIFMPYKDSVEMACDMIAAGQVYLGKDWTYSYPSFYWENKKESQMIDKRTKEFLSLTFKHFEEKKSLSSKDTKMLYKKALEIA